MIKKIIKKISNIDKEYVYIFFANLLFFMPVISKKFFYGHDIIYHFAQVNGLTKSILAGNFTKISSMLVKGFGYGASIFYPKLPHYICSIINILTGKFSAFYSINIYFIITSFIACIMMYKLIKLITENKTSALLGSIFYLTMPYYISDTYVRATVNEFTIAIFIPMIFIGLIGLLKENKKQFYIYFTIGYIGFLNSHLVLCVYFTIFVLVFMLFNIKKYIKRIKELLISSGIILTITLPNIILLIEHKLTDLYVVFDPKYMKLTAEGVKRNGISLIELLYPSKTVVFWFINIVALIFLILGIWYFIRKENKNKIIYGLIGFTIISIYFSMKIFPYELLPKLLLSIQFPFRINLFTIFGISVLASFGILLFKKEYRKYIMYIAMTLCLIIACFYINKSDIRDIATAGTLYGLDAETGWTKEYLTKNTYDNYDYLLKRDNKIKTNKNIKIKELKSSFPSIKFKVEEINEKTKVELPRLYYLGYKVRQNNKTLNYKCNKNGFIEIVLKEKGIVELNWIGTPLYNIFRLIRVLFIISSLIIIIKKHTKFN